MAWVLRHESHYKGELIGVAYHKRIALGILHECTSKPEDAKQYRTKKDAVNGRIKEGLPATWEPVKYA